MVHNDGVTTLNDIPEYLKEPERAEWDPVQGIIRGSVATFVASVILGGVWCAVTWFLPTVASNFWLLPVEAFVVTWILFAVMHRAAQTVGAACTTIVVIHALVLLLVQQFVTQAALVHQFGVAAWPASLMPVITGNIPSFAAIAAAAFLCRDGNGALCELADLLMTNPLTGRRV